MDLGQARNAVLVSSADAVIGVGGSWGGAVRGRRVARGKLNR
jgi:hypothetical protein